MGLYKVILPLLSGAGITTAPLNSVFVYKITFKKTGEYYIGQTDHLKRRLYRHFFCIRNTIREVECMAFPFHKVIAKSIKTNNIVTQSNIDSLIITSISFEVLHVAENKVKADVFEYSCVNSLDKLCLNRRLN
jgi:hypothetical protein